MGKAEFQDAYWKESWDASGVRTAGMPPKGFMGVAKPKLSEGRKIQYPVYARDFDEQEAAVLYMFGTCYYEKAGYEIFFELGKNGIKLMEKPPEVGHPTVTYYSASAASEPFPPGTFPRTVTIVDGHGEHGVPVKMWDQ